MSYPILYDRFTVPNFNSNGLGVLSEAASCTVKEERNGSYELEMQYPVKGVLFKSLLARQMILAKHDRTDDAQVFDIYSVSKPTQGMVTVRAKHISNRLSFAVLKPFVSVGLDPKSWFEDINDPSFSEIVGGHNMISPWVFSSDCDGSYLDTSITIDTYMNLYDLMLQQNGPLLGRKPIQSSDNTVYYEGFGEDAFDYRFGYFTVEVLEDRGQVKDIVLRRDKNVKQLTESYDDLEALHGLVPFWRGRSVEGNEIFADLTEYSSPDVIEGMILSGEPGTSRVEVKDFSSVWEQQPTDVELYRAGVDYMNIVNTNNSNNLSYVVDLAPSDTSRADLQTIQLCDTVTVQDDLLGICKPLKVVSLTYDVLKDEVTEIQLGRQYPKLSTEMKRVNDIWVKSSETTQNEETDASAESKKRITSVTNHVQPTRAANASVEKIATIHQKERDGSTTDFPVYAHAGGGSGGYDGYAIPLVDAELSSKTTVRPSSSSDRGTVRVTKMTGSGMTSAQYELTQVSIVPGIGELSWGIPDPHWMSSGDTYTVRSQTIRAEIRYKDGNSTKIIEGFVLADIEVTYGSSPSSVNYVIRYTDFYGFDDNSSNSSQEIVIARVLSGLGTDKYTTTGSLSLVDYKIPD